MNKEELHYLNCTDENCEKAYCVNRRDLERRILTLEVELENYELLKKLDDENMVGG